jgi:hypothetical protein
VLRACVGWACGRCIVGSNWPERRLQFMGSGLRHIGPLDKWKKEIRFGLAQFM